MRAGLAGVLLALRASYYSDHAHGPEPSAAAFPTVPARSQLGRQPASADIDRRTSPRLSETAATRTNASDGSGDGAGTGRITSLLVTLGSTTTARICSIAETPFSSSIRQPMLNQTTGDSYTAVTTCAAPARRSIVGLKQRSPVNRAPRGLQSPLSAEPGASAPGEKCSNAMRFDLDAVDADPRVVVVPF